MIYSFGEHRPQVHSSVFVAPDARIIGNVHVGIESSIWFGTLLRGDVDSIRVGARTNIQDQSMLHVSGGIWPASVGDDVTIGHKVMLHGCKVGNRVLVGMNSILLDGCEIGDDCIIGAGSLVLEGTKIPPGTLAVGSPCKVKRDLRDDERARILLSALHYIETSREYMAGAMRPLANL